ncbi:flagellin lysine-N-methylase [Cohnella lupini]|uniref:Lysine-N-methylase n=1 Tax=Cohnella lupini TaxID=1294267 RepID=A0A3D9I8W0_9BACL|nr:flagellin lysine-N-methylase [Cohnella lupini]RED57596.1 lysine-N-methylase [Cohnella lupini]
MNNQTLQPEYMSMFRCIGSECEDTCCAVWNVAVDRETYQKYQGVTDSEMSKRLKEDVVLRKNSERTDHSYASMKLNQKTGSCSFLDGGLCAIHGRLGEEYLSSTCASYPRKINEIDGAQEMSAVLSCPAAARLALLNPNGIEFEYVQRNDARNTRVNVQLSLSAPDLPLTMTYFWELRVLSIEIMQNRKYSLSHRFMLLAVLADQVDETIQNQSSDGLPLLIERFRENMDTNPELTNPDVFPINHLFQLRFLNDILLSITENKIWTNPRYKECLDSYISGMQRSENEGINELLIFFETSYEKCYSGFLREKEYILENYLVNYIFSTLFPISAKGSMFDQVFYLGILFSLIRMQLVGIFANSDSISEEDTVKLIQSFTKNFDHSVSFKKDLLKKCELEEATTLGHLSLLVMY